MNNTTTQEGKWHETLNQIRLQLLRGMDGETSTNQRKMGLNYGINFGVNLLRLREIAKSLPTDEELADHMWQKDVREMRLLSIMIRPAESLSLDKAIALAHEADTLEIAEQLVFLLFRNSHFALELMTQLFSERLTPSSATALIPYLLLNHSVSDEQLTPTLFEGIQRYIVEDFTNSGFCSPNVIYNALLKTVTERPDIHITPLLEQVASEGTKESQSYARLLKEIAKEEQVQ